MNSPADISSKTQLHLLQDFGPARATDWQRAADKLLKGAALEDVLVSDTYEAIRLEPIYHPQVVEAQSRQETAPATPALADHTWEVAQELPLEPGQEYSALLHEALDNGQTAVNIDLQRHSHLKLENLRLALGGVDLATTPVYISSGISSLAATAFLTEICAERKFDLSALQGSVTADPVGSLAATGKVPCSLSDIYDLMAGNSLTGTAPNLQTVGVSLTGYQNAGANAIQELAFALATGTTYLRELSGRCQAVTIDDLARRMRFSFAIGPDFFLEISKLRAGRICWGRVIEAFGADPNTTEMVVHAETTRSNKAQIDTHLNVLRTTTEAMAAVLGGCTSLNLNGFATNNPREPLSVRLARNTQIILREESALHQVQDPAAGSSYVETLTSQLAEQAWELFQQIEAMGGMVEALRQRFPQTKITKVAEARRLNAACRKDTFIGINRYVDLSHNDLADPIWPAPAQAGPAPPQQVQKLHDWRNLSPGEIMSRARAAAVAGATAAHIDSVLPDGNSAVRVEALSPWSVAAMFEDLRFAVHRWVKSRGAPPSAVQVNLGSGPVVKARSEFVADFLGIAGIRITHRVECVDSQEALTRLPDADTSILALSGSDEEYARSALQIARTIRKTKAIKNVVLAGNPGESRAALQEAGIDQFFHAGVDVRQTLTDILTRVGVFDA